MLHSQYYPAGQCPEDGGRRGEGGGGRRGGQGGGSGKGSCRAGVGLGSGARAQLPAGPSEEPLASRVPGVLQETWMNSRSLGTAGFRMKFIPLGSEEGE